MRAIVLIIIIALFAGIASWFMPWYSIAVVSFIVMLFARMGSGRAFLTGFLGIALLWLTLILYADIRNDHILSARMAILFGLPNILFILVNVILGGLVGGMAGWAGASTRAVFTHKR